LTFRLGSSIVDDKEEVDKIGEKMGAIKEVVPEELRNRLREFDYTVQVYANGEGE